MLIVIAIPFLIVLGAGAYLFYARIVRPKAAALGMMIPKVCVVSTDEMRKDCENIQKANIGNIPLTWRDRQWRLFTITNGYIAQMTLNTRLLQKFARFDQLRIDPLKMSSDHDTRETLTLRLAEDAKKVRWLLIRAQLALVSRMFFGKDIRDLVIQKLQQLMREYKLFETNAVNLVGMAKEECYYAMLVERLGLNDWKLTGDDSAGS